MSLLPSEAVHENFNLFRVYPNKAAPSTLHKSHRQYVYVTLQVRLVAETLELVLIMPIKLKKSAFFFHIFIYFD